MYKLPLSGFQSTEFDIEKMLRGTPNSQWFDPNDKSTWFEDSKLTIQATDPTRVKYLKNKVGNNYIEINDTALTVSTYNGLYMFELDGINDARIDPAHVQDLINAAEPIMAEAYAASEAENAKLRKLLDAIVDEYDSNMHGPILYSIDDARIVLLGEKEKP